MVTKCEGCDGKLTIYSPETKCDAPCFMCRPLDFKRALKSHSLVPPMRSNNFYDDNHHAASS